MVVYPGLDWVIAGGESGPGARPPHPDWFRSLRDQCQAAGVPFFFKQWGEYGPTGVTDENHCVHRVFRDREHWIAKARTWMQRGDQIVGMSGRLLHKGLDFKPHEFPAAIVRRLGKGKAGRMLDGRTWDEMPSQHRGQP